MSALTFTLRQVPPERLDLSPLTPDALAGLSKAEIEKIEIGTIRGRSVDVALLPPRPASASLGDLLPAGERSTGSVGADLFSPAGRRWPEGPDEGAHARESNVNAVLRVGDLFRVKGRDAENVIFEGGSSRFDCVAAGLSRGTLRIIGAAGAQAGRLMRGGSLLIEGDAGPFTASGMRGGRIEITGNAGDRLGAPLAGEMAGMNGGVVIVRGKAGARAADRMRRGLIAVAKGCGDYPGSRMIAGTLVVLGKAGAMPGYLMRRGTIVLAKAPTELSPGFVETGAPDLAFASLTDRYLMQQGVVSKPLLGGAPHRFGGDNAVLGLGEILIGG